MNFEQNSRCDQKNVISTQIFQNLYNFISTLGGSMYRSFVDQCYTLACKLGLSGIFSDLERFLY